jgi:hypothetical protein
MNLVSAIVSRYLCSRSCGSAASTMRPVETQCAGTRLLILMPTLTCCLDVARAT